MREDVPQIPASWVSHTQRSRTWPGATLRVELDKKESKAENGNETEAVSMGTALQLCAGMRSSRRGPNWKHIAATFHRGLGRANPSV